jgi:UDP-glucose 4-epimerase
MHGSLSGRAVLVTGGAGFVGSHLVDALAPANEVTVLDDRSTGDPARLPPGVDLVAADVADPDALARATPEGGVVFHCAARTSVERSVERPVEAHATNCEGSLRVLEAARRADARVVVSSSAAVYGPPDALPVAEDDPKRPRSPYGVQKLSTDHLARLYHDLHGVETVALRYFNVYGPRQRADDYAGVVAAFLDRARTGDPLVVHGDGGQTRDFVHVADVVRANLAAARTDAVGRAFNVGTGEATSVAGLADLVADLTDHDAGVVHEDARPGDVRHSRADLSRARADLGYAPSVDLTEGLGTLLDGAG